MSSSPTRDALASVLDTLAIRLANLEAVMQDFGTRVPSVDIRAATHVNVPEGFHTTPTKGKGKGKAPQKKPTAPPPSSSSSSKVKKTKEKKSTTLAATHAPHCSHFHQAQTFSTEGRPDRLLVTVVVPAATAGHVVGKAGKGLKQIHDISGARVTAYEVATSPDERHLSLRGTDTQISDALSVLGKRLARKRVHYPKKKPAVPASTTTAPPPSSTARPKPSASSKPRTNLPPPIVQTPSTSGIVEVPANEPEEASSEEELPVGSPMPLSTPMAPTVTMGSPTPTLATPEAANWSPMEVDSVIAYARPRWLEANPTELEKRRTLAASLVFHGQSPHPSAIPSGRGTSTPRRSGHRPPRSRGRGK